MQLTSVEVVVCAECGDVKRCPLPNQRQDFFRDHQRKHNIPISERRVVTVVLKSDEPQESDFTKLITAVTDLMLQ